MPLNKIRPVVMWDWLSTTATSDRSELYRSRLLAAVLLILIPIALVLIFNPLLSAGNLASIYHPDFWLEVGAAFLAKPFTPTALARKVRQVLEA